jgi:hypothetical protein
LKRGRVCKADDEVSGRREYTEHDEVIREAEAVELCVRHGVNPGGPLGARVHRARQQRLAEFGQPSVGAADRAGGKPPAESPPSSGESPYPVRIDERDGEKVVGLLSLSRGWIETGVRLTDEQKSALDALLSHHAKHPGKRFPAGDRARHLHFIREALVDEGDEFQDLLRSSLGRNGGWEFGDPLP